MEFIPALSGKNEMIGSIFFPGLDKVLRLGNINPCYNSTIVINVIACFKYIICKAYPICLTMGCSESQRETPYLEVK
jgi:hypothetical protein